jgi:hypothetical protein
MAALLGFSIAASVFALRHGADRLIFRPSPRDTLRVMLASIRVPSPKLAW